MQTQRYWTADKHEINSADESVPASLGNSRGCDQHFGEEDLPSYSTPKENSYQYPLNHSSHPQRQNREEKTAKGHYQHNHTTTLPHQLRLAQKHALPFSKTSELQQNGFA